MMKRWLARFARKAQWMRATYTYAFGNPTWSGTDYKAFMEEGLRKNPSVRAAKDYLADAASAPAPVLYKVGKSTRLAQALEGGYAHKSRAARGQVPTAPIMRSLIRYDVLAMRKATGLPEHLCRQRVIKRLTDTGELVEIPAHPILDLLSCPNPWTQTTFESFIDAQVTMLVMTGEVFIEPCRMAESGPLAGIPDELHVLESQYVVALPAKDPGTRPIDTWQYRSKENYTFDPDPLETELFYGARYRNPDNLLRGVTPLEAAIRSIDAGNEARKYNKRLLERGGMPPYAFIDKGLRQQPTAAQREAFREAWAEEHEGADNAGAPVWLGGEGDLKVLGFEPEKMMWGDTLTRTDRDVALVLKIPPVLLGDTQALTFKNYPEARKALYTEAGLPMADWLYGFWNSTWVKRFGDDLLLDYDTSTVEALQDDVNKVYERAAGAGHLTINEKRAMTGHDALAGGDVLMVPVNMVPLGAEPLEEVKGMLPAAAGGDGLQVDLDGSLLTQEVFKYMGGG